MNKEKILLFIKIPPPVTGATSMNKYVYDSELLRSNFNIHSIPISYFRKRNEMGKWMLSKAFKIINIVCKLIYELVLFKPRFIYFQLSPHGVAFLRDFVYILVIKLFKVKIVYHLHGKGIKQNAKVKWKKILYKFAFRNSDVICLSPLLSYDIKDVFNGTIYVVNNGIPDFYKILSIKPQKTINSEINILYLSNLRISKGIMDFIEALNLLNKRGIRFKAFIVGAEADLSSKELNTLITGKNLNDKVIYKGPKYNDEKYKILSQSDLFVLPTKNECFPTVILEAMQFQLPVISTYEAAIPEIVDSNTGILVDKNSPFEIASEIEKLIHNPRKAISMGKAGRKKFENQYSLTVFEKKMHGVFCEILSNG